jgi:hypothetical protein
MFTLLAPLAVVVILAVIVDALIARVTDARAYARMDAVIDERIALHLAKPMRVERDRRAA